MIPREILKKIRQIELRTNRIVTASSERGCVAETSRSTPAISNAPTNHHALRLGLPPSLRFGATGRPQPRSVSVSRNSKPLEFETFRNYGEFAIIRSRSVIISPH